MTTPNEPTPEPTPAPAPDDGGDDDGSGPSSHETAGTFPADEVRETFGDS